MRFKSLKAGYSVAENLRWLFLLPALLTCGVCGAQTVKTAASLANPLDNLVGSARDLGMGSAFVGVADDASALYFNCAGLSGLTKPSIAVHHNSYLAGTFQETLEASFPAGDKSALAFALNYVDWGKLDLRDDFGASQGNFNDSNVAFTAGWGKEWFKGFSAGLALRALQQKVVDDLYDSLSADFGVLWSPGQDCRLGLSYLNLGTNVGGNRQAGEVKGGGSRRFHMDRRFDLLAALSGSWIPNGKVGAAQCGVEGLWNGQWAIRAGYQIPFYDNQVDGFSNFTAGAGFKVESLALDYAYLPFGTLGVSHRISLSYLFDLRRKEVQVPVTVLSTDPVSVPSKDLEVHFKIPSDPLAVGGGLEKKGKFQEAVQVYGNAIKERPDNVELWSALGRLYYQLGHKDYAVTCFERVLKLNPDDQKLGEWLRRYKATEP